MPILPVNPPYSLTPPYLRGPKPRSRGFGKILGFETPKFSGAPSARFLSFCAVEGQFLSETRRKRTSNLQEKHCFQGGNHHTFDFFRACGGLKLLLSRVFSAPTAPKARPKNMVSRRGKPIKTTIFSRLRRAKTASTRGELP